VIRIPKPISVSFFENIKSASFRFHQSTERFFEERKKEANYKDAIILFIFSVIALTLLSYILSSDLTKMDISLIIAESQSYLVNGLMRAVFFNISLFLMTAALYLIVLSKGFKIKINFSQVLYFYGMIVSVSVIANVAYILSSVIQIYVTELSLDMGLLIISILFMLFALYLMLTAFKVLNGFSYKKTVLAIILVAILAGMLLPFLLLFTAIISHSLPGLGNPETYYYYNITTNQDGSITATYAWMLNSTNKPQEICYVGFPKGWELADIDTTAEVLSLEWDESITNPDIGKVLHNAKRAYFIFTWTLHASSGALKESIDYYMKYKNNKETYDRNFIIENVTYGMLKDSMEFIVLKLNDGEDKIAIKYKLFTKGANRLGYDAIYKTTSSHDTAIKDLNYIVNHSKCYKYG